MRAIMLGFETSCDETAVALVERRDDGSGVILSQRIWSQIALHRPFGGVVPEVAARSHSLRIVPLLEEALSDAGIGVSDVMGVCATAGPGLEGGLLVGTLLAKGLALGLGKPFWAVHHLEGHALVPRLTTSLPFPFLVLLISGGHTQILAVEGVGHYKLYGTTLDDALGEAFDKVAKMLGLGYPGGPEVERRAQEGEAARFVFPVPLRGRSGCDFSFSGLKTAVRQAVLTLGSLEGHDVSDVCAGFQATVVAILNDRLTHALERFAKEYDVGDPVLVACGGVAANRALSGALEGLCGTHGYRFYAPPPVLCTDNAAMIAWAALERWAIGERSDPLSSPVRARWPLGLELAGV